MEEIYERLRRDSGSDRVDAGVRITATARPAGPEGTKVAPPSYPVAAAALHPYVVEKRHVGGELRETVLLDSYQSQANRCEEALLAARDSGRIELPLFELRTSLATPAGDRDVRLTSLEFPHRYADAYLRDSEIDGARFDRTDVGRRLRQVTVDDARALFELDPGSLVYGAWDSHRKGRQAKFARGYQSTVVGFDPEVGVRKGGRLDPGNLTGAIDDATKAEGDWSFVGEGEKRKGGRLSEIGHGNALDSGGAHGWVTVTGVQRWAFVSFATFERLRFGDATAEQGEAARAALAALALLGDRLAYDRPSWFFRSGCDLVRTGEEVAWEHGAGELETFDLDRAAAMELFGLARERCAATGLPMGEATIELQPIPGLRAAIEHAFVAAEGEG